MTLISTLGLLAALSGGVLIWWILERRRRTTHPVQSGYQADIEFPHDQPFELYHNALSLCSMKTRVCLEGVR